MHRRGIIDQKYLNKTSDNRPLGTRLSIAPDQIDEYIDLTVGIICELIRSLMEIEGNKA